MAMYFSNTGNTLHDTIHLSKVAQGCLDMCGQKHSSCHWFLHKPKTQLLRSRWSINFEKLLEKVPKKNCPKKKQAKLNKVLRLRLLLHLRNFCSPILWGPEKISSLPLGLKNLIRPRPRFIRPRLYVRYGMTLELKGWEFFMGGFKGAEKTLSSMSSMWESDKKPSKDDMKNPFILDMD